MPMTLRSASSSAALEERDCIVSRHTADNCWVARSAAELGRLPGGDFEIAPQATAPTGAAMCSNPIASSGTASRRGDELRRGWDILVDLHQRRRRSLGEPGCFASRLFHDFHREVADRLLERSQLRMSWLELDGTPAAAEYHFADGTTTFAYQGGVDPTGWRKNRAGFRRSCCLQAAIDEGHRRIDFLRGDEPYKAHWRAVPQATFDYRIVPESPPGTPSRPRAVWSDSVVDWIRHATPQPRA